MDANINYSFFYLKQNVCLECTTANFHSLFGETDIMKSNSFKRKSTEKNCHKIFTDEISESQQSVKYPALLLIYST